MHMHNQVPLLFLESLGTGEVLLIVFVIVVFFGGKRIPEMARVLGKGMREFKAAAGTIQDEIQKSVTEIERHVNVEGALREDAGATQKPSGSTESNTTLKEQPVPQLIRADTPENPKDQPLPPHLPPLQPDLFLISDHTPE
jgi:sec-independent protein translocase protein TatA